MATEVIELSSALELEPTDNRVPIDGSTGALDHHLDVEILGDESVAYPTGAKLICICLSVGLAVAVVGLDASILATAVPAITTHFKTISDVGWYYSAYRLASCSFQFMFGKMYSVFSTKYVYLAAIIIFEIGSVVAGSAQTSAALVTGRFISGIGTAGILSGSFNLLARALPLRQRPVAGGLAAGIEGISATAAPLLGGILTDKASWRWCFYINLPVGALASVVVLFFFEDPSTSQHEGLPLKAKVKKLNLPGTAIFLPSVTSLLLALQWGGSKYGWLDARIIVLFVLSVMILAVFGWYQYRLQDEAMLPPRVLTNRSIISGMWFIMCNNSAMSVVEYYMPIYFQVVKSTSATKSGILCLPTTLGLFASITLGSSGVSVFGYYAPFMIATSLLTSVACGLLTTLKVDSGLTALICYQGLLGAGAGLGFQGPQAAVQTIFSSADAPLGIATISFAQAFGPALFVPVAQTIFTSRLGIYLTQAVPGVNAQVLEQMGLLDLKALVPPQDLGGALLGYDKSVTKTFMLPLILSIASLAGSAAMEWKSVKVKTR